MDTRHGIEQLISPFPNYVPDVHAEFVFPDTSMIIGVTGDRGYGNLVMSHGGKESAVPVIIFRATHIGSFAVRQAADGALIPHTTVVQEPKIYRATPSPILLVGFSEMYASEES